MPIDQYHRSSQHVFLPPSILAGLIHFAEQHDLAYQHWFEAINLDSTRVRNTQNFVSFHQLCSVVEQAMKDISSSSLGLKIGSSEGLISMGILGFAMQACKTVADALKTGLHYHPISGSVLDLNFAVIQDRCEIELTERIQIPSQLFTFFCDEALSSIFSCYIAMVGDQNDIIDIELSFKPSHFQDYTDIFHCPVIFNSTRNVIRFKDYFLTRTLPSYSPLNYATAIQMCENALVKFQQINQLNYAVTLQSLIEQKLPERFEMKQAAEYLKLSERHLRRRLLEEGFNFQQIKQQTLLNKAKAMLLDHYSMTEISQTLGFSELREFRRAFKRWTGTAPSIYKRNQKLSEFNHIS